MEQNPINSFLLTIINESFKTLEHISETIR